jgi:hypothetical protein
MTGGYRTQLAPAALDDGQIPLEGEPRWDSEARKLGFWNFQYNKFQWFRIPNEGENENYVPQHEWSGDQLRFMQPDGTWGEYVDLTGAGVSDIRFTKNVDNTLTFTFVVTNVQNVSEQYTFTTDNVKGDKGDAGPAGSPPTMSFNVDGSGNLIFNTTYGDLTAVNAAIDVNGNLVVTYNL